MAALRRIGGCCAALLLGVLTIANWPTLIDAAPDALTRGEVMLARDALMADLNRQPTPDRAAVRNVLQARHLSQAVPESTPLNCADRPAEHRTACFGVRRMLASYDKSERQPGSAPLPVRTNSTGHALVDLAAGEVVAPMIVDTGSLATILPQALHGAARESVAETRVHNLGRLAKLTLVRARMLSLGDHTLGTWIAATSVGGFEQEGVLGLDVIYALGGVSIRPGAGQLVAMQGQCAGQSAQPFRFENGAVVADVVIDGKPHRALLDTGSARTFVLDSDAGQQRLKVRSDFGYAVLAGEVRTGTVLVGGSRRTIDLVRTSERDAFYPGTTALVGADVLLTGREFGICFEPGRFWIT